MRFHLVDRLDRVDPNVAVQARKLTSHQESYWRDDGRGLEMPAGLVLEALCQAGTWLVMSSTDFTQRAALLAIESVTVTAPVRPGDVLDIVGTVQSMGPETAVLDGQVTVSGRPVLSATGIMCVLVPVADLEDPDAVRRMHAQLVRPTDATAA